MATRIKILPEELINKIAAGEVVERPASVVKELVENAIDAGATEVQVEIRGGGRSLIQVVDNGCGMSRDDALLALERHATSKIASTEDLFSIHTLGFRGEALAAIAGVSKFELITRQTTQELGHRVFAQGGVVRQVDAVGAPPGTTMMVKELFFNTPARLKFLKSAAVETSHIIDIMTRLALSHEEVGFTLLRGPECLVKASAGSKGLTRLTELLGAELTRHLYAFRGERPGLQVEGFLSGPEIAQSSWSGLYAFVNRRFLRDRLVSRAVMEAFKGSLPKGRYPAAVVFLTVPPEEVDVNVHPGKIEVRFARPRLVGDLIMEAMQATLLRAPWKRPAAGLGVPVLKSASLFGDGLPRLTRDTPAQEGAAAELLEAHLDRLHGDRQEHLPMRSPDDLSGEPPFDPSEEEARIESLLSVPPPPEILARQQRLASKVGVVPSEPLAHKPWVREPSSPVLPEVSSSEPATAETAPDLPAPSVSPEEPESDWVPLAAQFGLVAPSPGRTAAEAARKAAPVPAAESNVPPPPRAMVYMNRPEILPGFEQRNFSRMRIIGQYANCFILCQDGDELVIIDQHAAHERVTFQQLRAAYDGLGAQSQLLLAPKVVDLPRREAEILGEHLETLERLGMEVRPLGGRTFAIQSLPVSIAEEDPASVLLDLAHDLGGDIARKPLQDRIYLMLATMACHGSIRANRRMTQPEMEALLKLLDGTDFSYACPHGRPLIARSTRREVERLFKRT
ncbi:MAG: DNA mismatch repair endonuclease MutL [Myxococcota bacterium]